MEPFVFDEPVEEKTDKPEADADAETNVSEAEEEEEFYDALSFDDLFHEHSQWLQRLAQLKPSYKRCVELACEAKDVHGQLQAHLESGRAVANASTNKRWSLFDEISQGNAEDLYEKKRKQLESRLQDIETSIQRFHEDVESRNEKLNDWQECVASKWEQVSSLFGLYGIPMTKASLTTMQWLHEKKIVPRGYLGMVDVGHYLCSALLPHRHSLVFGALVAQLATMWRVDWFLSARAFGTLEVLNSLYPQLREYRTSDFVIRTDTIIAFLTMCNCDVDLLTNLGLCSAVQLWMMLCANDTVIHYPYRSKDGNNDVDGGVGSEGNDGVGDDTTDGTTTDESVDVDVDRSCVVESTEYDTETTTPKPKSE